MRSAEPGIQFPIPHSAFRNLEVGGFDNLNLEFLCRDG